jgi:hypothetical protein
MKPDMKIEIDEYFLHALAFADNLHRAVSPSGIAAVQAAAAAAAASAAAAELLSAVRTAPVQEKLAELGRFAGLLLAE